MIAAGSDRTFELTIGRALRLGIMASSACLAVGVVMPLAGQMSPPSDTLLRVGLWLLMATPAARLLVSAVAYAQRREWGFVILTSIVLLELVASFAIAFRSP